MRSFTTLLTPLKRNGKLFSTNHSLARNKPSRNFASLPAKGGNRNGSRLPPPWMYNTPFSSAQRMPYASCHINNVVKQLSDAS